MFFLFIAGRKYRVCSTRASTYFAEHLVEDPTRHFEPVVIKGVRTGYPGSIFVKRSFFLLLTGN
jgi:hypothetical protein